VHGPGQWPESQYGLPPPGSPRSGNWSVALIASVAVMFVLIVAIIVVVGLRDADDAVPGGSPSTVSGPVDACLVGSWRQQNYQRDVELGDTEVGKRENLGTVRMTGDGKKWVINADGSAEENDDETRYSGKTADGRTVDAVFSGSTSWTLRTETGKLIYAGINSTAQISIRVAGVEKGVIELEPNTDPQTYSCTGDVWRTSSSTDRSSFSTYERLP
jgi:hypothetical protein